MVESKNSYTQEYHYNKKTEQHELNIIYSFYKNLNRGRRKEVRKRFRDIEGILDFIKYSEGTKEISRNPIKIILKRDYNNFKKDIEKTIEVYRPNNWRLKLKIRVSSDKYFEKNELFQLFNQDNLEKYLLFGNIQLGHNA